MRDSAAELLNIYARRATREGHAFRYSPHDYESFANDFGFEETADQRAAIAVTESRDKTIRDKDAHRPEVVDRTMSALNHREATVSTANESTTKPQMVVKYQDSLTSASATNMARFPALDRATGAKINRFVFRKNAPETGGTLAGTAITPAAGGAAVQKK